MTALLDGRPAGLPALYRPGRTFTFTLTWPAGYLTGRTWQAALDSHALAVDVDGDTMTITASAEQTETAGEGDHEFVLNDTTGDGNEPVLVGRWTGSMRATTSATTSIEVATSAGTVEVSVVGAAGRSVRPLVSVEDGWTTLLAERKAAASDRLFRVIGFGDSLGAGFYSSNFREIAYPTLIADALQAELGDGGSGWIDSAWQTFFFLPDASGQVTTTGAWTAVAGGPNHSVQRPTVAGNGATITSPFRGTTLDMVQRRGSGFGSWTYSIDGGDPVTVSAANATADIHTTTVTGLAPGDHTVTRTATTGDCRLAGIRGRNETGVLYDNYSRSGASYTASMPITAAADGLSGETTLTTTVGMHDIIDLVVLGLGVNEDISTYDDLDIVLRTLWDLVRRLGPDGEPPLIVIILTHVGKHEDADPTPEYPLVTAVLRTWGASVGAAVVDVWAEGRRSWDYWDGLGAWGDLGNGPDNVHLSDVGQHLTAASAIRLLTGGA